MTVRQMQFSDLLFVLVLCEELGYRVTAEELKTRFELIEKSRMSRLSVLENAEGQVIGFCHAATSLALTDKVRAEIVGLVITKKERRKGYGKLLVADAEAWAHEKGHLVMRVRSQALRESAHEFYRRLGFELTKIQNVFVKSLR